MKKKALAYRVERMRPGERWKKPPKFLAKHPLDKVPEIEDGDGLIFDLTVINAYLEEAYPNPPLMLRGALERAQARQLENFCDEAVLVADLPALWMPYWSPPE